MKHRRNLAQLPIGNDIKRKMDKMITGQFASTTCNAPSDNPGTSMLQTIMEVHDLLANVRKLRYRISEIAPIDPSISRTKSYEMVIFHPFAFDRFVAEIGVSEHQLPSLGLSPATDREWMEWAAELDEEIRNRKTVNHE